MGASTTDAPPTASGLLRWLAGDWTLRRSIGNGASMIGTAMFTDRGDGCFAYAEHGELTLANGCRLAAERRYLFEEGIDGFTVWFPEAPPRLFHRIALRRAGQALIGGGLHLCGDDRYDSRYAFHADGWFSVRHAVAGRCKDYVIETRYERQPISRKI
jgi:hypothetical protein